jgi:hypothetical protein
MHSIGYFNTAGHFAFYINATSTPQQKNSIRTHSRALARIRGQDRQRSKIQPSDLRVLTRVRLDRATVVYNHNV